jgi:hypothetical protein
MHRTFHRSRPLGSAIKRASRAQGSGFREKVVIAREALYAGLDFFSGVSTLDEFNERTKANMDVVLDEICAQLPNGGDHESRKFVAEQLMQAASAGLTTLSELTYIGRRALVRIQNKPRSA